MICPCLIHFLRIFFVFISLSRPQVVKIQTSSFTSSTFTPAKIIPLELGSRKPLHFSFHLLYNVYKRKKGIEKLALERKKFFDCHCFWKNSFLFCKRVWLRERIARSAVFRIQQIQGWKYSERQYLWILGPQIHLETFETWNMRPRGDDKKIV